MSTYKRKERTFKLGLEVFARNVSRLGLVSLIKLNMCIKNSPEQNTSHCQTVKRPETDRYQVTL